MTFGTGMKNYQYGNQWGELPQFSSLAGYGGNSPDVLGMSGGLTSQGGPDIAYGGLNAAVPVNTGGLGDMFGSMKDWTLTPQKDIHGAVTGGQWGTLGTLGIGAFNMYQGYQANKRADEQFNFQKSAFNKNYAAQRQATNTGLEDRQAARVASNPGAYESVGAYMNQNRIR